MKVAIDEWTQELAFLYDEFYVGEFRFAWPEADG